MAKRKSKLEIEIEELSNVLAKKGCTIIDGANDEDNPKLTIEEDSTGKTTTIDKKSLLKNTEQLNEFHGMYGIDDVAQTIVQTFKLN